VKKANTQYTVTELCQLFELSPSTYYYHARPKPVDSKRVQAIAQIQETAEQTGNTYGKRRMQRILAQQGIQIVMVKFFCRKSKPHLETISFSDVESYNR